jgi:S1-C subfamily serine protease
LLVVGIVPTFALAQTGNDGPSSGSAFAVHPAGKLLTNSHVVEGCSEVSVTDRTGRVRDARVETRDERNDLALISLDSPVADIASFRRLPVRSGEDVVAVGFPRRGLLATDVNVSKGIVSATAGLRNDTSQLQISAEVQPGNSGGPLLDSSGSIAGVVVAKLDAIAVANVVGDIPQNVNFAIKAEVATVSITNDVWNRMSALQQWSACEAAGTIRPQVRVIASRFADEEVDFKKLARGEYRTVHIGRKSRWI